MSVKLSFVNGRRYSDVDDSEEMDDHITERTTMSVFCCDNCNNNSAQKQKNIQHKKEQTIHELIFVINKQTIHSTHIIKKQQR